MLKQRISYKSLLLQEIFVFMVWYMLIYDINPERNEKDPRGKQGEVLDVQYS